MFTLPYNPVAVVPWIVGGLLSGLIFKSSARSPISGKGAGPAALGPAMASALLGTARLAALGDMLPGDRTELLELWSDLSPDRYAELFLVPGTPPVDAAVFDQPLGLYLQFLDFDTWHPFGWDPSLPEDPATGNVGLAAHAGTVQGALGLTATDVSAILADTAAALIPYP